MGFWIITMALTALCAAVLARAVLRRNSVEAPAAAYDLQVYRDQLKDVEKDLARGVISEEDAERLRTEVSRRILAADAKLRAATAGKEARTTPSLLLLGALVASLVAGSLWMYRELGAPGLDDLPLAERIAASDDARANRLSQADVEARLSPAPEVEVDPSYTELVEQLRAAVAARPGDAQGMALLARHEAGIGNFQAAHVAQLQLLQIKGEAATAQDFSTLADLMVSAARGYVSSDAEKALRAALARDPDEPRARYYLGLYMLQVDRPDAAFRLWRDLLEDSNMQDPWTPTVLNRISEVALRAGVQYDLPDIQGETTPDMIRDMVASLSARLATQGGTAEEWARLIRSHGVLGNTGQARAIWEEAQKTFERDDAALTILREAADGAGVLE